MDSGNSATVVRLSNHEKIALVGDLRPVHGSSAGLDIHLLVTYLDFARDGLVPVLFGNLSSL